jgi:lipoprotein-anchoring transpeptidase ErfK/SrfK
MGRNESLARIVMWLCFGTAILSLAVHWRITTVGRQFEQVASEKGSRQEGVSGKPSQRLGETALGGSVLPSETTQRGNKSRAAVKKFHHPKPGKASKNVAIATSKTPKTRLVVQGEKQALMASSLPDSLFPKALAQEKSSNSDQMEYSKKRVVVDLSDRRAYVYSSDVVIASYPIAVGKKGWETPTGNFRVMYMQHDPIWRHPITDQVFEPGPNSPLGERWIGFWSDGRNQIGFHGTPDIEVLGTAISHGCLRMRNPDVRLLYEQVEVGTPVVVRD